MNSAGCPQCDPGPGEPVRPHPRDLPAGLLEVEAYSLRAGYNALLEACLCPGCGRVHLFTAGGGERGDLPPDSMKWGRAA